LATVCPIFAWRGERSPCENPLKSPFGAFSRGDLSCYHPENTLIRHGTNQPFRVFAWRSERSPRENTLNGGFGGKDTTNRRRKGDALKVWYFRVAGRKVAMRKHDKVTIWRVFAWRLFAPKHDNTKWHKSATIPQSQRMPNKAVELFNVISFPTHPVPEKIYIKEH